MRIKIEEPVRYADYEGERVQYYGELVVDGEDWAVIKRDAPFNTPDLVNVYEVSDIREAE